MSSAGGCTLRINEAYQYLGSKERQVAEYIRNNAEQVPHMTLEEFSKNCGCSISTVLRFCKALQFSGYKELIRSIFSEINAQPEPFEVEDIQPGASPEAAMLNLYQCDVTAIKKTMEINDSKELGRAVEALSKARRIDFYGAGCSGLAGMDACNKFSRINKVAIAHTDLHNQLLTAMTLSPGDVAIVISFSGETTDIINVANEIRATGATLISLTKFGSPTLAAMADIRLYTASTETFLRSGAMSSRIAQLFVLDTLYSAVCSRDYEQVKAHLDKTRRATIRMHLTEKKD